MSFIPSVTILNVVASLTDYGTTSFRQLAIVFRCHFVKLPHKDGSELRVGNPLSKSFLGKVRDGVLSTESGHLAEKVLQVSINVKKLLTTVIYESS